MSTLHNSLRRLGSWAYRRRLTILAGALVLGFAVVMFATTFRIYDDRQATVTALQTQTIAFCNRGNDLRAALRDYLRQTIVIRPVPPDADDETRAELDERNRSARAALERGERVFAPVDCQALAAELRNPR